VTAVDVPSHCYGSGAVKSAQARGDLDVLVDRARRTLRVHFKDVDTGLAELANAMDAAFQ
jgi:transaldolase/glucose-6-phosphate isomerase